MRHTWTGLFRSPRGTTRGARVLRSVVAARDRTIAEQAEVIRALEEELTKLRSVNRIQQVEIDELTAVVARNLERVKAETRELGGQPAGRAGHHHAAYHHAALNPQEIDTDA